MKTGVTLNQFDAPSSMMKQACCCVLALSRKRAIEVLLHANDLACAAALQVCASYESCRHHFD